MKNSIINIVSFIALSLVVTISVSAQMSTGYKAEVPFDFTLSGKTFTAGEYRIERTNARSVNGQVTIREMKTKKAHIFSSVDTGETSKAAKLIFTNIDGEYFLEAISSSTLNAQFPQTTGKTMLAKNGAKQTVVALKPSR